jgi:hypothetical protein
MEPHGWRLLFRSIKTALDITFIQPFVFIINLCKKDDGVSAVGMMLVVGAIIALIIMTVVNYGAVGAAILGSVVLFWIVLCVRFFRVFFSIAEAIKKVTGTKSATVKFEEE